MIRDRIKSALRGLVGRPPKAPPSSVQRPPQRGAFRAVARSEAAVEGKGLQVEVDRVTVALFRSGGQVYAIDNTCLHEDGPLGEGRMEGCVVVCPYHDWRYDLRDGRCLSSPDRSLARYPAREEDGWIWLGARVGASSGDRGGEHDDGLRTV